MAANQRMMIMLALLAGAGLLAVFGDKTPVDESDIAAPVQVRARTAQAEPEAPVENPAITGKTTASQIHSLRGREYLVALEEGPKIDLFGAAQAAAGAPPVQAAEPPPPPPPAQPFNFIGRMYDRDHWLVFLEHEGKTHVLKAQDVVQGFRIDAISDQEIRLSQLSDKSKFVIPMGGDRKEPGHE